MKDDIRRVQKNLSMEIAMIKELQAFRVIKKGHFLLTGGMHSDTYIDKDMIFHFPSLRGLMLYFFDQMMHINNITPDVFIGPPQAGNLIASMLAHKNKVPFVPIERNEGRMFLRPRHAEFMMNKKVLLVEDMITTGGSLEEAIQVITRYGATVTNIMCLWNRTHYRYPTDIPMYPIIVKKIESFHKDKCPQCAEGLVLQNPKS